MAAGGHEQGMNTLLLGIALFITGSVVAIFCGRAWKSLVFTLFAASAQVVLLPFLLHVLSSGKAVAVSYNFSYPLGTVWLRIDPLAAFFALIISIGGFLAALYSMSYMKLYEKSPYSLGAYYFFMGALVSAMLLVVTVQNALLFVIVWEMMSLFSFFLVNFEHQKVQVRRAGLYYLIAMQVGVAFLIVAFAWTSLLAQDMDFEAFRRVLSSGSTASVLLVIAFFTGFGIKAGFIPFHSWLPLAHPAAPTGVSAVMSGVMIKTGIYGILRILLLSGTPKVPLAYAVFIAALLTGLFGIMNAVAQTDIKKLLAYSSIENIGIIGMGIGLGMLGLAYGQNTLAMLGFAGCLLHVFNHFTFKSLLFYGAGLVYFNSHTREIEKLGGLARSMPVTASLFLLGSLAICGLPPLNGFISEFALYLGLTRGLIVENVSLNVVMMIGIISLALIGVTAVLVFTRLFSISFLGKPRHDLEHASKEGEPLFLMPLVILAVLIIMIGTAANLFLPLLTHVAQQFVPGDMQPLTELARFVKPVTQSILILCAFIVGLSAARFFLLRRKSIVIFKTWDCGYQADCGRLQYTAASFSSSFTKLVAFLVPQKTQMKKPEDLLPKTAAFESHSQDVIESRLVQPLLQGIRSFFDLFTWIQSGHTQQYILYGLIFLIILVVWIIGVR